MRLQLALAGAAVVIGLAAPAHADANQDQSFLDGVKSAGLTFENADNAIKAGQNVCEMTKSGKPAADVVKLLQDQNPGLTQEKAAKFTAISISAYCPDRMTSGSSGPSGTGGRGNTGGTGPGAGGGAAGSGAGS